MKMLDFLASSKRFRMAEMLRTGPVKSRLADELSLSYAEFSYQILQANDWYHLSKEHNCYCQASGGQGGR
jgi:tyrosyl-tRNA synthetase